MKEKNKSVKMNKVKAFWSYLQSTLWFVPTLLILANVLLATFLINLEAPSDGMAVIERLRLFGMGAEEARAMLSTIASSMMSIVGITFSMTIVTLTLASNQYTPRILRNFTRSRLTQVVIGLFIGIFAYCLIILSTIREGSSNEFVPTLAVFVAFLAALVGVCLLIFFIHHIASSIQASNILASIAQDTEIVIDQMYPLSSDKEAEMPPSPHWDHNQTWTPLFSQASGYIQNIQIEKLKQLAEDHQTVFRMEHVVGEFVVKETPLLSILGEVEISESLANSIYATLIFSSHRSLEQDVSFGIRQIVDIALKALSPGINDTTTAVMSLNHLTTIVVHLAQKKFNPSYHYQKEELRVITKDHCFKTLFCEAFDQIRENGKGNLAIALTLARAFELVLGKLESRSSLRMISQQIDRLEEVAKKNMQCRFELKKIEERLMELQLLLKKQFNACE